VVSEFAIRLAAHHIRLGAVIAYPTDTVYGLGCDPLNTSALDHLNALKQRAPGKGLILLAGNLEQLDEFIDLDDNIARQRICSAKQPTSWVVPARAGLPLQLTGGNDTLAIRVTDNPVVARLCQTLGHPLVSSSANPAGRPPAANSLQLHRWFHGDLASILIDDNAGTGRPSTLRHIHTQQIYRS
jgi:L-threonylcarbamoyladenylate synthase